MKTVAVIGAAILTMCLTSYNRQKPDSTRSIVLPSSHLIGCKLSGCPQMWLSDAAGPGVIFPQNVSVDIDDDGVLGVVAKYDKSTSVDEHFDMSPTDPLAVSFDEGSSSSADEIGNLERRRGHGSTSSPT